jgi:hypothetical protein
MALKTWLGLNGLTGKSKGCAAFARSILAAQNPDNDEA